MFDASLSRILDGPEDPCCSLLARSTRLSWDVLTLRTPDEVMRSVRIVAMSTQWERLDSRFIRVSPIWRFFVP